VKTLLLMRHAKSSWSDEGLPDRERPLNERGEKAAPRMGKWLRKQGLLPDLVVSSDAKRAVQTAQAVIEAVGYGIAWRQAPSLYAADIDAYYDVLRGVPDDAGTVLVVAHNPGTAEMVAALTGEDERMPTAAVAQITLPLDHWRDLAPGVEGELVRVGRPRELE
jgi:phosphohistidine phosphatase